MSDSYTEEDNECGDKRWRADTVRLAVAILESEKDFRTVNVLGRGTYGDVYRMYDPDRDVDIAVKVVTRDNIADVEIKKWPELHHPNIVPLLELFSLTPLGVAIFIMPVQEKTLHDVLIDKHFSKWGGCLPYLKVWIYEALCGLSYMHSKELCHLDIKADNVLISNDATAMLCDFSFLNFTTKPLKRYDLGLPYVYRPPESCLSFGNNIKIDGIAYDMWGFGAMVVEMFTHFELAKSVASGEYWHKEVYPVLFKALQENKFKELMLEIIPAAEVNTAQVKVALNFIYGFLRYDPKKRLTARQAMQHMFLNRGIGLGPAMDPIWIHKRALKCSLRAISHNELIDDQDICEDAYRTDESEKSLDSLEIYEECLAIQDSESIKSSLEKRRRKLESRQQTPGIKNRKQKFENKDDTWNDYGQDQNSDSENLSNSSSDHATVNLCCSRLPNEKKPKTSFLNKKNDFKVIDTSTWNKGKQSKNGQIENMVTEVKVINSENSLEGEITDGDYNELPSQHVTKKKDSNWRHSPGNLREFLLENCNVDTIPQYLRKGITEIIKKDLEINNNRSLVSNDVHQEEKFPSLHKSSDINNSSNIIPDQALFNEKLSGSTSSLPTFNDSKALNFEEQPYIFGKDKDANNATSDFSESNVNTKCGEAFHRMNTLRKQLSILDEKFSELESILICEKCSNSNQFVSPETLSANHQPKSATHEEIKQMCAEEKAVDANKNLKVLNVADASTITSPFNERREDVLEQYNPFGDPSGAREIYSIVDTQLMPISIHGLENSYVRTEASSVDTEKKKKKRRANRRFMNWMRQKYLAMERIIKCMPYNIIK